uniref:Ligand-gated ion channel 4 n=1 Tax=Parascaris univalens TaxID=6257 RepID=A0A915CBJ8_PARUN
TIHHTLPTNVTLGFLLNQIVEMDERNQVLTTRSWLNVNWLDPRLTWNASEWDGIKTMYVPYQRLWKPDIILVNNAVRQYYEAIVSTDIMTTSDGNVTWLFSAIFKSSCQIKVRYYPFDDQECFLRFASWSHELKELDLKLITDKGDLSSYMNNSEFDLLEMTATREIVPFPTDPLLEWPVIVIRIRMHRRPLFYVFNHILPCVLISSMAVLGFFMPPETGEKINMCITTMLSMGVYLQSITESIPPTSEAVPLIGMYYVASLFMVCLATCINVITLNVHRNGAANQGRRVPWWMEKYILGYMASLLRMTIHEPDSIALLRTSQTKGSMIRRSSILRDLKRVKNTENRRGINEGNIASGECECRFSAYSMMNRANEAEVSLLGDPEHIRLGERQHKDYGLDSAFLGRIVKEQLLPRITNQRPQVLNEFEERFRLMLKRIYRSLQQHEIREEILDERKRIMWQWQQLATVVDRFLLVLFFLATVSTIAFFLVLPVTFRSADGQSLFL